MSQQAVILSLPHGGTHFATYFFRDIMGLDAVWAHFEPNAVPRIFKAIDDPESLFIVVKRRLDHVAQSWVDRGRELKHFERCKDIRDFIVPLLGAERTYLFPIDRPDECIEAALHIDSMEVWRKGGLDAHAVEWMKEWPTIRKENVPSDLMSKHQLGVPQ